MTHSHWTLSHAASPLCSGVWCWLPLSVLPRQLLLFASLLSSRQLPSLLSSRQLPFASPYHFRIRRDFMSKNPLSGFAPKLTRLLWRPTHIVPQGIIPSALTTIRITATLMSIPSSDLRQVYVNVLPFLSIVGWKSKIY